ncbi:MAG: hypothetical protein QOJ97_238 [Solirubrobacteraceae bacterium]|nr:hypothetical protein [Solirubrobacteraceae bacterium]
MRAPIRFALRNLLFGASERDCWALYRLPTRSYEGLTDTDKTQLLKTLATFAYRIKADFSLLRVGRAWSVDDYVLRAEAIVDERYAFQELWERHLAAHRGALQARQIIRPEVYLSVRLASPRPSRADLLARARQGASDLFGLGAPQAISERRLRALAGAEAQTFARVSEFFDAAPANTLDVQWLVRRAFCRGLGEPVLDVHYRPQALVVADGDQLAYQPLEVDVLRLFDCPIWPEDRGLSIAGERGDSHQAMLVLGALPEQVAFPGHQAELLFAPLEALDFPVDGVFSARWVPNDRARALVRRKVVDADNIYSEETHGDHGPSTEAARRPQAARALEDYLSGETHPPLLQSTIGFALGAPSAKEREERIEALRAAYQPIELHRPYGEQVRLFVEHLPGQSIALEDYSDYLLVEQLGAMVPLATHAVGSDTGPYIGSTLSGSRQPVLFDITAASRTSRPPAMLLAGTLGSGKTMLLQLLLYQAFLAGSRVVDIDPKGDHNLHRLPGVKGNIETIELAADARYRGLLDPLRIAGADAAEDLAFSFLSEVLPAPVPPQWRTALRAAVKAVARRAPERRHCGAVIAELQRGRGEARKVGEALDVYADSGLAQLGFADERHAPDVPGTKAITSLRIRNLPLPLPGTAAADFSEQERIGQAVLRLTAAFAMRLVSGDRSRHKAIGFDEVWFLIRDAQGRRLIEHLNLWGRSENATPILVAHFISHAEEIDNLLGVRFTFGFESEADAATALRLVRRDPENSRLREQILGYRLGQCLMSDLDGRVEPVQIDPGAELLRILDSTPRRPRRARRPGS